MLNRGCLARCPIGDEMFQRTTLIYLWRFSNIYGRTNDVTQSANGMPITSLPTTYIGLAPTLRQRPLCIKGIPVLLNSFSI